MAEPIRRIPWPVVDSHDPDAMVTREWLVTNGLGGYASGTVSGVITRRYHSVLTAALPAPFGRIVMLSHVAEQVRPGEEGGPGSPGSNDAKCRPNQVFAVALPHPVLARERWAPVVRTVRDKLLTPVGLRSLAPDDPDFKSRYFGDLRARDASYHQGTVWRGSSGRSWTRG